MIKISLLITIIGIVINMFSSLSHTTILINAVLTMFAIYLLLLFSKLVFISIAIAINHRYGYKINVVEKTKKTKKEKI